MNMIHLHNNSIVCSFVKQQFQFFVNVFKFIKLYGNLIIVTLLVT